MEDCAINVDMIRANVNKNNFNRHFLTGLLLAFMSICAQPLHALEFECEANGDKRFIRMELPGISHLCEVTVTYLNNERKVMWYADHDSLFCSDKTAELTEKYQSKWGFQCTQWPDHDGIDQLNDRQRAIVDAELKQVIAEGEQQDKPFMVEGLKVAASNPGVNQQSAGDTSLLVLQFFLHEPDTSVTRDITHIISDKGGRYDRLSRLDSLANYVDPNEGYIVNSALISSVTDNGAMEVITVLDAETPNDSSTPNEGCYGNQTLTQHTDGKLIARTPHRFVCVDNDAG